MTENRHIKSIKDVLSLENFLPDILIAEFRTKSIVENHFYSTCTNV